MRAPERNRFSGVAPLPEQLGGAPQPRRPRTCCRTSARGLGGGCPWIRSTSGEPTAPQSVPRRPPPRGFLVAALRGPPAPHPRSGRGLRRSWWRRHRVAPSPATTRSALPLARFPRARPRIHSSGSRSRCCGLRAGWGPSPPTPSSSAPPLPPLRTSRCPSPPPSPPPPWGPGPAAAAAARRPAAPCPTLPRHRGGAQGECERSASPPSLPESPLSSGERSAAPSPEASAAARGEHLRPQPPALPCRPRWPGSGPAARAESATSGGPSSPAPPPAQQRWEAWRAPPARPRYGGLTRQVTAQTPRRVRGLRRGSPTPDPPPRPLGGAPQRPAVWPQFC